MLKSFQIRNFRLFNHLEVKKLSNVNLIVGMNNAGKSTFLEAIELYASNISPMTLLDLVESRQGSWISEAQQHPQNFLDNPIRRLFFSHRLPKIGEEGISLGEISLNPNIHIGVAAYQIKSDDEGTMKRTRISSDQFDKDLSSIEVVLVAEEGEKTRRILRLDKDFREIRRGSRVVYERQDSELKYKWQFVSTENIPNRKLAALWDLTSLTSLESEVISALKLIEPKISGVAFVEDISKGRSSDNRIPIAKIEDIDEPLPLKSMGDGLNRLFYIMVALVNAKDGILLIDEFENGLHWTVQPKVWDIVFHFSEKLNVQVFATTHSRDCVKSFDSAWNKHPLLGAFFRLEAKNNLIKVKEYSVETLTDSIEMDVETR
ncbi:AAA family ATPase [Cronbergia sp. UHCC 0137]|uniref:AAA family ATPase n=1 Tax=Cronbergia sp. UHCC 0137 TaxID=3110239 RepID=UPI002B1F4AA4|nr:AAA family ATPase [Cronbergia sp. UHCC 0137]MEA5621334.1 AAA family ATPase [Cronbergia sp. UHCC 0137]